MEWYVILKGYGTLWTPVCVMLGKLEALTELTDGLPITSDEERKLRKYHMTPTEIGDELHLVGHFDHRGNRVLDRRVVRVKGPTIHDI